MIASPTPRFRWVDSPAGLDELVAAMAEAPWTALDSESNSAHVYRERVCLLQLNCDGRIFLVDALALGDGPQTLARLKPLLEDPAKRIYLHGAEYDVICLKRSYGIALRGIFDSQQAASMLGWPQTGYGAVVERCCDVKLPKAHSQYDWGTRPLDEAALRYALDDVVHLPAVCRELERLVAAAGLEEELAIALQAVEEAEPRVNGYDPANLWRIKGVSRLPRRQLPLLTALYAWRDGIARERDQPPGRLLNNEALLAVAREAPQSYQQLKRIRMKSWFLRQHGESLLDCIRQARAEPPAVPPRPRSRDVDPTEERREKRLKDWRKGEAAQRGVALQVVLPAKALEHLKQHGANDLDACPQLGPKRIARYGETLRKICR